jgi:hypothetical protein
MLIDAMTKKVKKDHLRSADNGVLAWNGGNYRLRYFFDNGVQRRIWIEKYRGHTGLSALVTKKITELRVSLVSCD